MTKFRIEIELLDMLVNSTSVWMKIEEAKSLEEAREKAENIMDEISDFNDEVLPTLLSITPVS